MRNIICAGGPLHGRELRYMDAEFSHIGAVGGTKYFSYRLYEVFDGWEIWCHEATPIGEQNAIKARIRNKKGK